ncbi:AraC-type DNA-binding protein [Pseudobutyrivibrio sp. ACV-2]|uniref:AraC family transcriptional regulator n=1 Tax=Pseudobutyrivibrio sp. ACV-2 TaxID=1520801 RepID=UPI0008959484|nr:AraC family transcriptional regulator [Pseudobutyrivibrio sp. ACV-2]SEA18941.1 AraC-type DNA-binding protein [Pseudobutyrivibrio sp. ACV-2]
MNGKYNTSEQNKQLVIASFLQREADVPHHTYDEELLQYEYLKNGDLRSIEESIKFFRSESMGKLSTDPVRNIKYLFVATTTLATRFAIEGGLEAQTAYNLSDYYIRQMDICDDVSTIEKLHTEMITDFTKRLAAIHSDRAKIDEIGAPAALSKPTYRALDYIYFSLHQKITLKDVAEAAHLSPNYLNTLFKKEKGCTIQEYICSKRIEAAQNMLLYSDFSESDIGEYLAFSSTSYFIKTFRERVGMTPMEFQRKYFRHARFTSDTHISYKSENPKPDLPLNNT